MFHKILNGTHFTQDGKHYCQESDSDICPFCDCTDGRFHRFWICPQFEHHRRHVTPEVFQAVHCLPEALTCSGWSLAPSTQQQWDQYFVSLAPTPVPCWTFDGPLNVFTDGSCHGQHRAQTRFAGWAVVLAATEAVHDYTGSQVLDSGVLPGYLQSAVRAEIYAVLRALQVTRKHAGKVMIWCDCAAVVKRLRRMLAGHDIKQNCSHSDLWTLIRACLDERGGPTMITKVAAHQAEHTAKDVFTEWCVRHNSLADKQAVRANVTRTPFFWNMLQQHHHALDNITAINRFSWILAKMLSGWESPLSLMLPPLTLICRLLADHGASCPACRYRRRPYDGMEIRLCDASSAGFGRLPLIALRNLSGCLIINCTLTICVAQDILDLLTLMVGLTVNVCLTCIFVVLPSGPGQDGLQKCGVKPYAIRVSFWKVRMADLARRSFCSTLDVFHCLGHVTVWRMWTDGYLLVARLLSSDNLQQSIVCHSPPSNRDFRLAFRPPLQHEHPRRVAFEPNAARNRKSEKSGGFKHGFYFPYMGCHPSH